MVTWKSVLALSAILGLGVIAIVIAQGEGWMFNRDFFTYWGGGRGILDNANLYDPQSWAEITRNNGSSWLPNPIFIYAPVTAVFFAPLATVRLEGAAVVWVWLSEIFVALAVLMIARDLHWKSLSRYAPFWAVGFVFFLPVLLVLLMGQVSALLLVLLVATAALWDRGLWFSGGLLLGLTIIKPQPVAFLFPMLALWLLFNRRWHAILGLVSSLGIAGLGSFLLFPTFIQDWQVTATAKVGGVIYRMPTLWGLTADFFGASTLTLRVVIVVTLMVFGVGAFIVARWGKRSALELTGIILVFSLLATPYLWNYDQTLLLIPLLVALIRLDQRGISFKMLALLPLAFDLLALLFFGIATIRLADTQSALLAILVGLLLWFSMRTNASNLTLEY
jgi:Glycosyltransferase family 87